MEQDFKNKLQTLFAENIDQETLRRVLDFARTDYGLRIDVDSDQLSLTNKVELENKILKLASTIIKDKVYVNFKKKLNISKKVSPQPSDEQASAFGLKFNRLAIPKVRKIIAVASGKGGVGKSTVAANLATAIATNSKSVGLLDADIYGPSMAMMFKSEESLKTSHQKLLTPINCHGVKVVSLGMLSDPSQPLVWRGPMVAKAFEQLCYEVDWGELDVLIIDLPPGTGDVQLSMIESLPIDGVVIVTTPQDIALLDVKKAVTMFNKLNIKILGMIQNMAIYSCTNCGHSEHIFGDKLIEKYCNDHNIDLLCSLPLESKIATAGDVGIPAVKSDTNLLAQFSKVAEKCHII